MKKSKFTEEQIAYALRQVESGTPPADVCRQLGVSEATFYIWKKKYAHLGVSELRQLRSLEDENAPPEAPGRRPVARQAHPDRGPAKKSLRPTQRRELAGLGPERPSPSAACGPVIWRSSVARRGIAAVDARRPDRAAVADPGAWPTRGRGSGSRGSGCCCDGRAGR